MDQREVTTGGGTAGGGAPYAARAAAAADAGLWPELPIADAAVRLPLLLAAALTPLLYRTYPTPVPRADSVCGCGGAYRAASDAVAEEIGVAAIAAALRDVCKAIALLTLVGLTRCAAAAIGDPAAGLTRLWSASDTGDGVRRVVCAATPALDWARSAAAPEAAGAALPRVPTMLALDTKACPLLALPAFGVTGDGAGGSLATGALAEAAPATAVVPAAAALIIAAAALPRCCCCCADSSACIVAVSFCTCNLCARVEASAASLAATASLTAAFASLSSTTAASSR